jgi:hypothetical protein
MWFGRFDINGSFHQPFSALIFIGMSYSPTAHIEAPAQATSAVESNGQIGNLQLSSQPEADLVNFFKILSDGYIGPSHVSREHGL